MKMGYSKDTRQPQNSGNTIANSGGLQAVKEDLGQVWRDGLAKIGEAGEADSWTLVTSGASEIAHDNIRKFHTAITPLKEVHEY